MTFLRAKHFSLLHLLILCCLAIAALAAIDHFRHAPETAPAEAQNCPVDVHRIQGLRYVRPIVFVSDGCESHELAGIKQQVNEIIARYQAAGDVNIVSVYLRNADGWTSVNPAEQYQPGSLFKVPLMIVALRMNEMDPGFLDRKIVFARPFGLAKKVNIKGKSIELGKSYTIRELMGYMIRESDNQATALLERQLDFKLLQKMFADIGLAVPNGDADQYLFTAPDYTLFFRAIFNAGYLTVDDSEYAAELLTKCTFADGLRKGVPQEVAVGHKFGEAGNDAEKQLHESGIVYLSHPYMLTVMTKGKDFARLSALIADISAAVYQQMKAGGD